MSDATVAALWGAVVGAVVGASLTVLGTLIQSLSTEHRRQTAVRQSIGAALGAELHRAVDVLGKVASKQGAYGIVELSQIDIPVHSSFASFAIDFPPDAVTAVLGFTHAVNVTRDAIDSDVARRQTGNIVFHGAGQPAKVALELALAEAAALQVDGISEAVSALRAADERLVLKRTPDGASYFEDPSAEEPTN